MNRILALLAMLFAILLVGCISFPSPNDMTALEVAVTEGGFEIIDIKFRDNNTADVIRAKTREDGNITLIEGCVFSVRQARPITECWKIWPKKG